MMSTVILSGFLFIHHRVNLTQENIVIENIEVLAGEEDGVPIQSCYMDGDIVSDDGSAASYTICNSRTTSSTIYKCGNDKRGEVKYSPHTIPTYTCIK